MDGKTIFVCGYSLDLDSYLILINFLMEKYRPTCYRLYRGLSPNNDRKLALIVIQNFSDICETSEQNSSPSYKGPIVNYLTDKFNQDSTSVKLFLLPQDSHNNYNTHIVVGYEVDSFTLTTYSEKFNLTVSKFKDFDVKNFCELTGVELIQENFSKVPWCITVNNMY